MYDLRANRKSPGRIVKKPDNALSDFTTRRGVLLTFAIEALLCTFQKGQIVAEVLEAVRHLLEVRILQINVHILHVFFDMAEEGMGCKSIEDRHPGIPTAEHDAIIRRRGGGDNCGSVSLGVSMTPNASNTCLAVART